MLKDMEAAEADGSGAAASSLSLLIYAVVEASEAAAIVATIKFCRPYFYYR